MAYRADCPNKAEYWFHNGELVRRSTPGVGCIFSHWYGMDTEDMDVANAGMCYECAVRYGWLW